VPIQRKIEHDAISWLFAGDLHNWLVIDGYVKYLHNRLAICMAMRNNGEFTIIIIIIIIYFANVGSTQYTGNKEKRIN